MYGRMVLTIHEISGKNEQAECGVGLKSLSTCDRPPSAARQDAPNENALVRAPNEHALASIRDMTLFDPFTGGFHHSRGGN